MNPTINVDDYIALQKPEVQPLLEKIRQTIKTAAPSAQEVISYAMPAYKQNGMLVYFAAFKNHIGFYALPTGHEKFKNKLAEYKQGKGSVQFPINEPIPLDLIAKIVKFRIEENLNKGK